jgi:hypothetical protein
MYSSASPHLSHPGRSRRFAGSTLVVIEPIRDDEESEPIRLERGATIMVQHFIDSTLPAHDPNFPKPRGLIPVPPEVAEWVAKEDARVLRELGAPMAPEARQRILDGQTLSYYYDDAYIAYRRTPQGVEVLAVGREEVNKFLDDHPLETRRDVRIGVV